MKNYADSDQYQQDIEVLADVITMDDDVSGEFQDTLRRLLTYLMDADAYRRSYWRRVNQMLGVVCVVFVCYVGGKLFELLTGWIGSHSWGWGL